MTLRSTPRLTYSPLRSPLHSSTLLALLTVSCVHCVWCRFDAGFNEALVAALARPLPAGSDSAISSIGLTPPGLQIVYAEGSHSGHALSMACALLTDWRALLQVYANTAAAVNLSEQRGVPLITYSWEPRSEIMTPGRFVRLQHRNMYYCLEILQGVGALVSSGVRRPTAHTQCTHSPLHTTCTPLTVARVRVPCVCYR